MMASSAELRAKLDTLEDYQVQARASASEDWTVGSLMVDVLEELVDDSIFAVVIEEHRKIKLGLHCPRKIVVSKDSSAARPKGLVDVPGYDVFGLQPAKVAGETFPCPNCASMRHPSKFAPHLEKCMGMGGRESRRVRVKTT